MKIYTQRTKNDLTAWASIRLEGPNKIWGPGIDLRTPGKNFSLRPWVSLYCTSQNYECYPIGLGLYFKLVSFQVYQIEYCVKKKKIQTNKPNRTFKAIPFFTQAAAEAWQKHILTRDLPDYQVGWKPHMQT